MLGITNRSLNTQVKDQHTYIDLTASAEPTYVCETCGIQLAYYPQAQIDNPFAGKSYICPKCHEVTDSSLEGMQHIDNIRPIDVAAPAFAISPELKGNELILKERYRDPDPEPQEEEILRAKGCTIIDKRVDAKNDFR